MDRREISKVFATGLVSGITCMMLLIMVLIFTGKIEPAFLMGDNSKSAIEKEISQKAELIRTYIDKYYLDDIDSKKMADSIYKGIFNGLGDDYAAYYTAEEYKDITEKSSGTYCGIGAYVTQTDTGDISIVKPVEGGPAERAGIKAGDIIYAVDVDDDNSILKDKVKHHAGDKVTLKYNNKTTKEYEIISVIKRHSYSLTNRISSNFSYYVTADEFKENLPDQLLMSFIFDTKEGQEDQMEEFLENYTSKEEPLMSYESRKTYEKSFNELVGMITITGTGLSGIIGLIGILNFINVIITSITTRKREFAMREAIGMTKRQLKGMLRTEGIFYPVLSIVFSLVAGTIFSLTVIKTIGNSIWFINYKFTLVPILLTCPVLLVFGMLMPGIVFTLRKKESITEQLRD